MMRKLVFILLATFFYSQTVFSSIHYNHASEDPAAQKLFDKGMLTYYAYSYAQAEYDFRQALVYDPACGLCYWGLAIAKKQQALELGQPFATMGYADIKKALSLVSPSHHFQYDIVQAAMTSFSLDPKINSKQLQLHYIDALQNVYQKYKDNLEWREESLALLVDAIAYYSDEDNDTHCPHTNKNYREQAIALLRPILKDASYPDHPGLIHTYIHITERDVRDPLGLIAAQKLPAFSQGEIAHYTHMPNHIYWRRGLYDKAIQANLDAIAIDKNYFKHNGAGLNSYYYEYHYLHSYHFLAALGILTNNYNLAIQNAQAVKNLMDVNRIAGLKDYRDTFFSLEHLVLARFNQWDAVLQLEIPPQTNELGLLFIDFSKALAYLHLKQEIKFKQQYAKIKNTKYIRTHILELQKLILTYLAASEMGLHQSSLADIEKVFLQNKSDVIEDQLFMMNPPIWFFPYQLLLSDIAYERGDLKSAIKYHKLYEKMYPNSTLGSIGKSAS